MPQTSKQILATNAGAVLSRKCRATGTTVTLYKSAPAGLPGKWCTVCENHGTILEHDSRKLASSALSHPDDWCSECAGEVAS